MTTARTVTTMLTTVAADLGARVSSPSVITQGSREQSKPVVQAVAGPAGSLASPPPTTGLHGEAPEPNAEPTFADCESFYQEVLSHVSRKSIFTHGALASLLDEVAAFLKTGDDRKARLALHWYAPAKKEFAELRARGPALPPQHLAAAGPSVATPAQQAHATAAPGPAHIPAGSWVPATTPTSAAPSASNYPPHQLAAFGAAPAAGQPAGQPAQPSQDSRVPMAIAPAGTPSSAMPPSPMITSALVSGTLLGTPNVLERTATGSASGPPPTMSDALKRAVLGAAPRIFALERMTSGMAALVFHIVSKERLYELDGFASMEEYAHKRLGVQGEANLKVFRRAGRAMWDNFPGLAMQAVEAVAGGVTFVTPDGALGATRRETCRGRHGDQRPDAGACVQEPACREGAARTELGKHRDPGSQGAAGEPDQRQPRRPHGRPDRREQRREEDAEEGG